MDLGRNHTCFCTKTLVMTPAVLHTSFWPNGADLHIYTVSFWISHLCSMIVTRTGALGMVVEQEGLRSI